MKTVKKSFRGTQTATYILRRSFMVSWLGIHPAAILSQKNRKAAQPKPSGLRKFINQPLPLALVENSELKILQKSNVDKDFEISSGSQSACLRSHVLRSFPV